MNYVPIILAMTIMTKNAAEYGLTDLVPQAAMEYALDPDTAAEIIRQVSFERQTHNFEALLEVSIRGGVPLQPRLVSIRVH